MSICPKCGLPNDLTIIHVCPPQPGVNECPVEARYPWPTMPTEIRLSRTDRLCILAAGQMAARPEQELSLVCRIAEDMLAEIERQEAGK